MKTYHRPSDERGHVDFGWLRSAHTFSFGRYVDRDHMAFGPIRVINDDIVAGGGGFDPHPHNDMEILTYVTQGALAHKDSMGNGETINAGDVQIMSAGTGVTHSEFNASKTEDVKLLQIWIIPEKNDLPPRYAQKTLPDAKGLLPIATPGGSDSAVDIKQDVTISRWTGEGETTLTVPRGAYVHVIDGEMNFAGEKLGAGDGLGVYETDTAVLKAAGADAHALVFTF